MKKIVIILILTSFVFAFASVRNLDINYPSKQVININFKTGDFSTNSWIENGIDITRFTFENANYYDLDNNDQYGKLILSVAIGKVLPSVQVRVLDSKPMKNSESQHSLYRVSDIMTYRDQRFVNVIIDPFLDNSRVATDLTITLDLKDIPVESADDEGETPFINKFYAGNKANSSLRDFSLKKTSSFTGEWLNLSVNENGMYSISRSDLVNAGITGEIDDSRIYLYAGPRFGGRLSEIYPDTVDLHLKQIPLLFLDAANNDDDKWVFYASPNSFWERKTNITGIKEMRFIRNSFEDDQHFRLFVGNSSETPLRMNLDVPQFSGTEVEQNYTYQRLHSEEELINPAKGGELWFGKRLSSANNYSFYLNNLYRNSDVSGAFRFSYGKATKSNHTFTTLVGDSTISSFSSSLGYAPDVCSIQSQLISAGKFLLPNSMFTDELTIRVNYQGGNSTSEAFLDYFDIIYPSTLEAIGGQLELWFKRNTQNRKVHVTDLTGSVSYVFNVEDPFSVDYFPVSGTSADILIPASGISSSFIVTNEGNFITPNELNLISDFDPLVTDDHANQVDMIIITADDFLSEANRLAEFKETRDKYPLTTLVKTYKEIVNQYNAGNRDPSAIWHFLADMYNQCPGEKPKYVLLIGDGHYDYQNRLFNTPVYIPYLYEPNYLWPCDDIYTMVNSIDDNVNDMALGRIPANSLSEVKAVVDKIIEYDDRQYPGEWQLNAMLVADDPSDEPQGSSFLGHTMFITDSETMKKDYLPKVMQVNKVYLTEYPERYITEIQTMGRDGAREDIMEAFLNGVSFVNYYGHGDPSVWTQEKVFVSNDLVRLDVNHHYPFIIAATCSWGRSDNPDYQSMAEDIMLMEENGAIATMATVRSVTHGPNVSYVEAFMDGLFIGNPDYSYSPLFGDALLDAKIAQGFSRTYNNRKFMYFGDPTLVPIFPQYAGSIDSVSSDTLRALDRVTVSGTASDRDGSSINAVGLNGKITVYDNDYQVTRSYTRDIYGNQSTISYYMSGNRLFNGNISFNNNEFSTEVFIPKDIQYNGTHGKIRMAYWDEDGQYDGAAAIDNIYVGGINPDAAADNNGPDISIIEDNDELMNGAIVFDTSSIRIVFEDASGINITGTTGHVLEMSIDNDQSVIDLSELFSYDQDDFSRGEVTIPVNDYFDEGEHLIEISAFDNYNNFSNIELTFNVLKAGDDLVQNLVNFPNPFKGETDITFSSAFTGTADVRIYTISGKPVNSISDITVNSGFNAIPFTANDEYGHKLAAGVYMYVLEIDTGNDIIKQQSKMVILP